MHTELTTTSILSVLKGENFVVIMPDHLYVMGSVLIIAKCESGKCFRRSVKGKVELEDVNLCLAFIAFVPYLRDS